ncbi:MAG: hypothetical protein K1X88_30995 [Nannocystaceae bacterium]|nr:hypothetical protein [Nannocystaceae bacterium]
MMRTIAMMIGAALFAACGGDDGGASTGGSSSGGASTSGSSSGGSSSGGTATGSSSGGSSSGADSGSSGGSSGGASSSDGSSSGGGSSGSDSSGGGSSSTGGGVVAVFSCDETSVVELPLVETIAGSFDADGTPLDVSASFVLSGAVDFAVDMAVPVAADDPYAADVAYWEQQLTMVGWDVNPPGDPTGDRRYLFIPDGAQGVAIFPAFYYHIYEAGGNGQFDFDCTTM